MMIEITPLDTLFFRTGKPFTMGEDTFAEVFFPPSPSTIYGAIRSFLIFQRGGLEEFWAGKYKDELGTKTDKGSLKVTGPIILNDDQLLFPAPLDLIVDENTTLRRLDFIEKPSIFISDHTLPYIHIHKPKGKAEEAKGWITDIELVEYLNNKKSEFKITCKEGLFLYENKTGIARERNTNTTKEGHLYRIPMIRLNDKVSIVVKIEGVNDIPDVGILQLGGESKGAKFRRIEDKLQKFNNMDFNLENRLFKIYLATPAIFKKGWLPDWINDNYEGEFNGIKLKLIGACIGKPLHIGGWDIASKRPKPLRKAVPAGSVYYFEILDSSEFSKIKETFHLKNMSDINPEEGFGLGFVGR